MENEKIPIVSVCIPVYNNSAFLVTAIESILNQTFKDLEIIVVDDGSTCPDVSSIISSFGNSIKALKQTNKGPAAARNLGIKMARGKYIAFCDSDDLWLENKLESQLKILEDTAYSYVFSSMKCFDNKTGEILGLVPKSKPKYDFFTSQFIRGIICPPTVIIKREVFDKIEWFDENLRVMEDLEFFLRLAFNFNGYFITEALALARKHDSNTTRNRKLFHDPELIIHTKWYESGKLNTLQTKLVRKKIAKAYFDKANWTQYGFSLNNKIKKVCPEYIDFMNLAFKFHPMKFRYLRRLIIAHLQNFIYNLRVPSS